MPNPNRLYKFEKGTPRVGVPGNLFYFTRGGRLFLTYTWPRKAEAKQRGATLGLRIKSPLKGSANFVGYKNRRDETIPATVDQLLSFREGNGAISSGGIQAGRETTSMRGGMDVLPRQMH